MPTRKIAEPDTGPWVAHLHCRNPDHNPPNMRVFSPGTYEHTCPGCERKITFVVRGSVGL